MKRYIWPLIAVVEAVIIVAGIFVFIRTRPPYMHYSIERVNHYEPQVEIFLWTHNNERNMAAAEWNAKGKPIWAVLSPYHVGLGFVGLDDKPVTIFYLPKKNKYRIVGKAGVCYPNGVVAKAEDTDIKAPGPPHRISGDRLPELHRCERLALDHFGARIALSR